MSNEYDTTKDPDRQPGSTDLDELRETGSMITPGLRILRLLGRGGQGDVYEVVETATSRHLAIKLLKRRLANDGAVVARLEREAETASAIQHPNVTRIFGLERTPSGEIFLRLELLSGEGLDQKIKGGPLSIDEACDLARQIASGLGSAHELGVIHRDVKPANIFLASDGLVKIMDFGIAKAGASWDLTALTHTGSLIGTPAYMSPEQIRAPNELDHRTDIYSLGLVFYEMLTGERAFKGREVVQILMAQTKAPPTHPRKLRPEIPSPIAEVVMQCLAKRADARIQSMSAFIERLDRSRAAAAAPGIVVQAASMPARTSSPLAPVLITSPIDASSLVAPQRRWVLGPRLAIAAVVAAAIGYGSLQFVGAPDEIPAPIAPPAEVTEAPVVPPPFPAPPVVPEPEPPRSKVASGVGSARITSEPDGAVVLLGTTLVGQTPLDFDLIADIEHGLTIRKDGYEDATVLLRVSSDEHWSRHVRLEEVRVAPRRIDRPPVRPSPPPGPEKPGYLTLETDPWTMVDVDGRQVGSTPLWKIELAPGEHTIRLTNKESNVDVRRSIVIRSGETAKQRIKLR